jgi:hypothetical protein
LNIEVENIQNIQNKIQKRTMTTEAGNNAPKDHDDDDDDEARLFIHSTLTLRHHRRYQLSIMRTM